VSRRHAEAALWLLAAVLLAVGASRWRGAALAESPAAATAVGTVPPEPVRVPAERLSAAARTVAGGNPFRLDRAPAPVGFAQPEDGGMMGGGMPPPYQPPPPPRPPLAVSGIAGPPWRAVLEGVPGRDGGVVVQRGDVLDDLRIREVTATTVVVAAPDTVWRLTLRRTWQ
jgi:hypothetical protein